MTKAVAHPFVKWAGGKTQLLPALTEILPKKVRTYYEPFLGGGAVFFSLAAKGRFEKAVLNDCNAELMDCFKIVRDFPAELIQTLRQHTATYKEDPLAAHNTWRWQDLTQLDPVARAARVIALNKTSFNGLYRVNRKGEFNVPWGRYKNPTICDATNLQACSEVLNKIPTTLLSVDFSEAVQDATEGDVVYFDPPYIPMSPTSNFASYTSDGFNLNDHYRLAAMFKLLVEKGVAVILSNSDTEQTRALYEGFEMHPVLAKRNINSKGDGRGPVGELIIVGRHTPGVEIEPISLFDTARCLDCGEAFPATDTECSFCHSKHMTIDSTETFTESP